MTHRTQKRILSVQDISCFGKCSLTVTLPIVSAVGIETAILPTAVLSTHTAGFTGFTFRDLTDDIQKISDHWASVPVDFDGIETGYLGSAQQIELVSALFDRFGGESTAIIVDPVMADNGALYPGFTEEYVKKMAGLCAKADYILPNMTEACLMLGIPYKNEGYDRAYIEDMLRKLTALGAKTAVLTGVSLRGDEYDPTLLGAMAYNAEKDEFTVCMKEKLDASFHGTGDVFASVFAAAIIRSGFVSAPSSIVYEAISLAADFVCSCIRKTLSDPHPCTYGVNFEACIPELIKAFKLL